VKKLEANILKCLKDGSCTTQVQGEGYIYRARSNWDNDVSRPYAF